MEGPDGGHDLLEGLALALGEGDGLAVLIFVGGGWNESGDGSSGVRAVGGLEGEGAGELGHVLLAETAGGNMRGLGTGLGM